MADLHEEDVLGKAYDGRLMRRLLAYAKPYRSLVLGAGVLLLVDGLLQLVGPLLTRKVIDDALPARDVGAVATWAGLFGISLLAQFVCTYGETMLTSRLGQSVMRDLRLELFAHLQRLSIRFFDRNPVGRLVTRVTSDVESLNELFTAGVVAGLGDLFTLAAISVVMLVIDWRLALAAFAVIPLVVVASNVFRSRVRDAYRDIRTRIARINAYLQERLTGIRVVQLFGRESTERAKFDTLNRAHLDAHLKSITIYALYFPIIELLTTIATASLIVAGARRVEIGTLTVGTVAAFLQLTRRFFQPLQDLSDKYNTLQQAMAASERIFKLLDTEVGNREVGNRESAGRESGNRESWTRRAVTVEFRDVWFSYDVPDEPTTPSIPDSRLPESRPTDSRLPDSRHDRQWVLRGVSFIARPGTTTALVGQTGSGKTTVVNLLQRFYEPQRGQILIDGVDIREIPVHELRERIGYVQQDIFLFAGDITSNIRLSASLSDGQVREAAALVGADRVIARLPRGYGHELGERGASISVGERQLLSFARAIAADPAVLVLDEATSAVDSVVEAEIQGALETLMRGRTTIAIAHRLSTILRATEILVMHHGEIRERGTHRELVAQRGLYERLYRLQIGELRAGAEVGVGGSGIGG